MSQLADRWSMAIVIRITRAPRWLGRHQSVDFSVSKRLTNVVLDESKVEVID